MSKQGTLNKDKFLGMPYGTAQNKLRKMVLFELLKRHNENVCYRCGKKIEVVNELSVEHKKAWLNISTDLYWDLNNVAFSHLHCNCSEHVNVPRPRNLIHGTNTGYRYDCRCDECKDAHAENTREYRTRL